MIKVEFTVEPFTEGSPGAHVTESIAAVRALGLTVDVGPFGSSFEVSVEQLGRALEVLSVAAYSHGATHVIIDTSGDAAEVDG